MRNLLFLITILPSFIFGQGTLSNTNMRYSAGISYKPIFPVNNLNARIFSDHFYYIEYIKSHEISIDLSSKPFKYFGFALNVGNRTSFFNKEYIPSYIIYNSPIDTFYKYQSAVSRIGVFFQSNTTKKLAFSATIGGVVKKSYHQRIQGYRVSPWNDYQTYYNLEFKGLKSSPLFGLFSTFRIETHPTSRLMISLGLDVEYSTFEHIHYGGIKKNGFLFGVPLSVAYKFGQTEKIKQNAKRSDPKFTLGLLYRTPGVITNKDNKIIYNYCTYWKPMSTRNIGIDFTYRLGVYFGMGVSLSNYVGKTFMYDCYDNIWDNSPSGLSHANKIIKFHALSGRINVFYQSKVKNKKAISIIAGPIFNWMIGEVITYEIFNNGGEITDTGKEINILEKKYYRLGVFISPRFQYHMNEKIMFSTGLNFEYSGIDINYKASPGYKFEIGVPISVAYKF